MSRPLRVLIVEDSEDDVVLLLRALRLGGYDPTFERVDTSEAMNAALDKQTWDIIIADYVMPHFSALAALDLLKQRGLDMAFIIVSGKIGEDIAVAAMKAGAHDYVMKDNFGRLIPAIQRELHEAEVRRERKRAEAENAKLYEQVKQHANELKLLVKTSLIASSSLNLEQVLQALAEHMVRQLQVTLCRICLLDKEGKILTIRAAFPIRSIPWEPGIGQGFELERLPCVRRIVELQGAHVFWQDALDSELDKIERDFVLPKEARSSLLIAMVAKGHTLGIITLVEARAWGRNPFTEEKINLCGAMASQAAMSVENAILFEDRARTHSSTLMALAAALDAREQETHAHCWRVREYTLTLAERLGVQESLLDDIATGALLHDVGKIGVSDRILLKTEDLSEEEWEEMKRHPAIGYDILRRIRSLTGAREIVYSHHERYDGRGYPRGLAGDAIPLGARIFAVADTFDAITSDRPYRKRRTYEVARKEILKGSGTQFDPQVVEVFLRVPEEEWERIETASEQVPYRLWLS
ncbi:MAG: HD domain-containing phosphohydrolase [Candidatus Methylomirabilales bacterium]